MKKPAIKLISIGLCCILFISMLSIGSSAESINSNKMAPRLVEAVALALPKDSVDIVITLWSDNANVRDMPSWPNRDKALNELKQHIADIESEFINKLSKEIEFSLQYRSRYSEIIVLTALVKDIQLIADFEEVIAIDLIEAASEPFSPTDMSLKAQFLSWIRQKNTDGDSYYTTEHIESDSRCFKELSGGKTETGAEWILFEADVVDPVPWNKKYPFEFGTRVLLGNSGAPDLSHAFSYFIYDMNGNDFFSIVEIDPDAYSGLNDCLSTLNIGRPKGDTDGDAELTILDATAIQRALVQLEVLPEDDWFISWGYKFSDFDGDGDRSILDATAIQRRLAHIDDV